MVWSCGKPLEAGGMSSSFDFVSFTTSVKCSFSLIFSPEI